MKNQHTPGPWGTEELNIRTNGGIDVATVDEQNEPQEADANARLIACAPLLLEALKEIAERGPVPGYDGQSALRLRLVATQSIARDAIAKAEGQL